MKKTLCCLAITALTFGTATAQKFILNGQLQLKEPVQKVYLAYGSADDKINDSTDLVKNKFNFKGQITEPTIASLTVKYARQGDERQARTERFTIFMEPGTITLKAKDSLQLSQITGSKAQKAYESYNKLLEPFKRKVLAANFNDRLKKASEEKNEAEMTKVREEYNALNNDRNENIIGAYVKNNPTSPIALYVLGQYAGYDIDVPVIEPIYLSLSDANKSSASGVKFKERIEKARATSVGAMAINFTQNDTLDKPVSLSDFKGQYVLIDFWASWCGPCRAENPNLVKAFHAFKDKGFTVLGVSLDQPGKKEAWIKAIHKDELTWTQVSDLKFWNNEAARAYGVSAIPQNFLIDPNGKIVAKNIRGEELNKTLAELIK